MPWLVYSHEFYLDLLVSMAIDQDFPGKQGIATSFFNLAFLNLREVQFRKTMQYTPRISKCFASSQMPRFSKAFVQTKNLCSFWQSVLSFFWQNGAISFLGPVFFFRALYPRTFLLLIFSIRVSKKSFHMGILSMIFVKYGM